jgi:hypothetical protein
MGNFSPAKILTQRVSSFYTRELRCVTMPPDQALRAFLWRGAASAKARDPSILHLYTIYAKRKTRMAIKRDLCLFMGQ